MRPSRAFYYRPRCHAAGEAPATTFQLSVYCFSFPRDAHFFFFDRICAPARRIKATLAAAAYPIFLSLCNETGQGRGRDRRWRTRKRNESRKMQGCAKKVRQQKYVRRVRFLNPAVAELLSPLIQRHCELLRGHVLCVRTTHAHSCSQFCGYRLQAGYSACTAPWSPTVAATKREYSSSGSRVVRRLQISAYAGKRRKNGTAEQERDTFLFSFVLVVFSERRALKGDSGLECSGCRRRRCALIGGGRRPARCRLLQ